MRKREGGVVSYAHKILTTTRRYPSLSGDAVLVDGAWVSLPRVPAKYVKWLRARQGIYREIANMSHLGSHR